MRKIVLFLLGVIGLYAIQPGVYRCYTMWGPVDIYLKPTGRAIVEGSRGFWQDYDDEALVIHKNWVLERVKPGVFKFRGATCKLIKKY